MPLTISSVTPIDYSVQIRKGSDEQRETLLRNEDLDNKLFYRRSLMNYELSKLLDIEME
ncbi:hypothetical protein KIN20_033309 [Parelaphostrongylus tenuis]|uniref:Uncharacterized protein n=1 Tax=Parelaphostrongylus tenuis TaxID=148309 RepID=A0AAD5R8I6_PARTN|nr:hypothetical protein KIN20_033309 [Parelaphostrongylus tenuis]